MLVQAAIMLSTAAVVVLHRRNKATTSNRAAQFEIMRRTYRIQLDEMKGARS